MCLANVQDCSTTNSLLFEEDMSRNLPTGLKIPASFANQKNGVIPVCLINCTQATMTVYKRKTLGYASPADAQKQVNPINYSGSTVKQR